MTAILHQGFCDSGQLWVICSTAVTCQRIGGILYQLHVSHQQIKDK